MKKVTFLLGLILLLGTTLFAQSETEEKEKTVLSPALLVIDVQKQYIPYMSKEDQDMAIEMMNWAIWIFRKYDLPVIRVYHTDPEWGPAPGTTMFEFHDSLKVVKDDPKIIKNYPSAFTKTELNDLLKEKSIHTLFLCGLSSVGCVLSTYMDAASHDYKAFMIKDAILSHKGNYTDSIEEIFNALDLDTIDFMINISRD